jgi:CheY-like chemotaxis protein
MMPIMDGQTFALKLRESSDMRLAATPIVLVTAVANPEDAVRRTGARAAVPKPVCFDRMMFEVARHCLIEDDDTQCAALHSRVKAWAQWTERREQRAREVGSDAPVRRPLQQHVRDVPHAEGRRGSGSGDVDR